MAMAARSPEDGDQLVPFDAWHQEVASQVQQLDLIEKRQSGMSAREVAIGAEGVDETPVLPLHVDDEGPASYRRCRRQVLMHDTSTLASRRISVTTRPKTSAPTRPTTPTRTPILARSTAAFAAQPPMVSSMLSAVTSSPAAGRCEMGVQT